MPAAETVAIEITEPTPTPIESCRMERPKTPGSN
jgi:hypothetical protein